MRDASAAPADTCHSAKENARRVAEYIARAQSQRGGEEFDHAITELESTSAVRAWDPSPAMPPDLLPRALFKCGHRQWDCLVWRVQWLCGPGGLAIRPSLWRWSVMHTVFKRGDARCTESFRLTYARVQLGLLQEGILTRQITPKVRRSLVQVQSGYERGVEVAHTLLLSVSEEARVLKRRLWAALADFVKAFPRTRRNDIFVMLESVANIRGGAYLLLHDMLVFDDVSVWHSGQSRQMVTDGLPEGGTLGPFTYILLPDSLARTLRGHQLGVGVGVVIPPQWADHHWQPGHSLGRAFAGGNAVGSPAAAAGPAPMLANARGLRRQGLGSHGPNANPMFLSR